MKCNYNSLINNIQCIFIGRIVKEPVNSKLVLLFCILIVFLVEGCSSTSEVKGRDFEMSSVVKNDVDLISEMHQRVVFSALKELAVKLYKRNPKEWRKGGYESLDMAVQAITADPFIDVNGKTSIDSIRMTFDDDYQGDRVKAFIVGIETMILASYNGDRSFYLYSMLEAQKLYDSARNVELASWLLRTKYDKNEVLFLLSTGDAEALNLSFERLFGKIINAQDMLAQIMADRNHRQIKNVIQAVATAFIPI